MWRSKEKWSRKKKNNEMKRYRTKKQKKENGVKTCSNYGRRGMNMDDDAEGNHGYGVVAPC